MSYRDNKWIFGTVVGLVASLPLMIPGCSPFTDVNASDDNALTKPIVAAQLNPALSVANETAAAYGRDTTLDDVIAATGQDAQASLLGKTVDIHYLQYPDRIDATLGVSSTILCTITISAGQAVSTC